MATMMEDDIIAKVFAPLAGEGGLGLTDDAALFKPPSGRDLVITKDALVADVHFFKDDPPDAIARKALRVNLSDLAAKGARPEGFFLGLALPNQWDDAWLARFAQGLGEDAAYYHCPLLGGDTVKTYGPLTLSITAVGSVPAGAMVRRSGAQPGDYVFVSGSIGDAALGLALRLNPHLASCLTPKEHAYLLDRYLLPQPRSILAPLLIEYASSAMDISDGLVGDLEKLMKVNLLGIQIDYHCIPLSLAAQRLIKKYPELTSTTLTGGDDYEILFTAPPHKETTLLASALSAGVPLAKIGVTMRLPVENNTNRVKIFDAMEREMTFVHRSYQHF